MKFDILKDTTPGPGTAYLTTGCQVISFQVAGAWAGEMIIEASNDGTVWFQVPVQNASDGTTLDTIFGSGIYLASVVSQFMRYNILALDSAGPSIAIFGEAGPLEVTPLLAQSLDANSGVLLNTNIASGLLKDVNNGLIESDAPAPIYIKGQIGSIYIIDTAGYDSIQITSQAMTANVTASNDQISWAAVSGVNIAAPLVTVTATAANSSFMFPAQARYIKLTLTVGGTATCYLRSAPFQGNSVSANITQLNGTAVVSAGAVGVFPAAGANAIAGASTTYPVQIGGTDAANLVRRLLTDASGRAVVNPTVADQSGNVRPLGALPPTASPQFLPVLPVQDQTMFEGQSIAELLAQMLTELKIHSYYLFNSLPSFLGNGTPPTSSEEPASLRNEPSPLN
jgi:hypothetical protein